MAEERGVEADIEVGVLFPAHLLVFEGGDDCTYVVSVGIAQVVEVLPGIEATDGVVTLLTVAGLDIEVVEPGKVLHERFCGNPPVGTNRPEGTPAVVFVEP